MKDLEAVKDAIKARAKLGEVLRNKKLISYGMEEEQFSCPFHGVDRKPSARYYKLTDSAHCFTCHESWDIFSYTMKDEVMSFREAVNSLIKRYHVDLSKLPDIAESSQTRKFGRDRVKVDNRKLHTEKIQQAIQALRDELDFEKYRKMVFAFMLLKHTIPDEKFEVSAVKLKDAILTSIKG